MNNEIRYLAQHLLHAGASPLSERDRRVIQRVARRAYVARDGNQVFDERLNAAANDPPTAGTSARPALRVA